MKRLMIFIVSFVSLSLFGIAFILGIVAGDSQKTATIPMSQPMKTPAPQTTQTIDWELESQNLKSDSSVSKSVEPPEGVEPPESYDDNYVNNGDQDQSLQQVAPTTEPSPTEIGSNQGITNQGYYATATENDLNKLTELVRQRDEKALEAMENAGKIYPVYPNQKVVITGCHGLICSTVTFRYQGKYEEHWTYKEAIRPD